MTFSLLSGWARRGLVPLALSLALTAAAPRVVAQEALDAAAAREHLTQGYKLKQQGQLKEALPHFIESLRLDPKLKTTINLADCEEKLGMLVESQSHWLAARDRARSEGDARVKQEAEQRLASLEQRLPRLNIQLAPGFPADAQVYRDDVLLGRVSLGTALPTNPGEHKITVRAPGREDWKYSVKMAERDSQQLTVTIGAPRKIKPGEPETAPAPLPPPATTAAPPLAAAIEPNGSTEARGLATSPDPPRDTPRGSTGTVQRVLGLVTGGLGVASFAVAGLYWQKAKTDIKMADTGRKTAQDDLLITNVSLVSGSVLVTAGIVLYVTAPSASSSSQAAAGRARDALQPSLLLGKNTAFFSASGAF
jgi:tetratricopeptide (TPR) repeat protein